MNKFVVVRIFGSDDIVSVSVYIFFNIPFKVSLVLRRIHLFISEYSCL